jgi:rhamnose transport system permease protein
LSAANQNEWIAFIKKRMADKYPGLTLATVRPSDDDRDKAFFETQTILKVHPSVKLIMAISAPAVPGAGEAIRQAGARNVNVIGLSLPSITRTYIKDGVVQTVILWNTHNLGYLTVQAASQIAGNQLKAGTASMQAGALGKIEIQGARSFSARRCSSRKTT